MIICLYTYIHTYIHTYTHRRVELLHGRARDRGAGRHRPGHRAFLRGLFSEFRDVVFEDVVFDNNIVDHALENIDKPPLASALTRSASSSHRETPPPEIILIKCNRFELW